MASTKLYKTLCNLSFLSSSLASIQGQVSSIYLFERLKILNISVIASATLNSSIFFLTFSTLFFMVFFKSLSKALSSSFKVIFLFSTEPLKYLLDIEIVRLTRFPRTFAKSEL